RAGPGKTGIRYGNHPLHPHAAGDSPQAAETPATPANAARGNREVGDAVAALRHQPSQHLGETGGGLSKNHQYAHTENYGKRRTGLFVEQRQCCQNQGIAAGRVAVGRVMGPVRRFQVVVGIQPARLLCRGAQARSLTLNKRSGWIQKTITWYLKVRSPEKKIL